MESEARYNGFMQHWKTVLEGTNINTLLDVSIGSGRVTIPVLNLGIQLSGSDLSEVMLDRYRKKFASRNFEADLHICVFRQLPVL